MKKILLCASSFFLLFTLVAHSAGYYGGGIPTLDTIDSLFGVTSSNTCYLKANGTCSNDGSQLTNISANAVSGLRTDTAGIANIPYINDSGNVVDLGLTGALSLHNGNLTVSQIVNFSFVDTDTEITISASKKGYVVPPDYNGSNVTAMTCSVYDLNGANAGTTVINLVKTRAGSSASVFNAGVNIANTDYTATSTGVNETNATLQTGDFLVVNVEAIAYPPPRGLSCTFIFAH